MKRIVVGIAYTTTFVFSAVIAMPGPAHGATAGCCMKRESTDPTSWWVKIDADVNQCKRLNQDNDSNDNILEPQGLYRWSLKC